MLHILVKPGKTADFFSGETQVRQPVGGAGLVADQPVAPEPSA